MNLSKALMVSCAFVVVGFSQGKAQAQSACSSTYSPPATVEERRATGLFDGKVGQASFKNSGSSTVALTLYHPDAPSRPFATWNIKAEDYIFLGEGNYGSDWGIQMNNGAICILGKISDWKTSGNSQSYFLINPELLNSSNQSSASSGTFPSSPTLTRKQYFERGNERYGNGEYQGAIEDFYPWKNGEHSDEPHLELLIPEMFFNRGNAYYKLGKYSEAIENYKQAIQVARRRPFPEPYYNMSVAELALGNEDAAASAYEGLLKLYSPPPPEVLARADKYTLYLEDLEFSNLDEDIFPSLSRIRWGGIGIPAIPKSAINTALNSCPKAIKYAASRSKLVARLKEYEQADMALKVENGSCPSKLR